MTKNFHLTNWYANEKNKDVLSRIRNILHGPIFHIKDNKVLCKYIQLPFFARNHSKLFETKNDFFRKKFLLLRKDLLTFVPRMSL